MAGDTHQTPKLHLVTSPHEPDVIMGTVEDSESEPTPIGKSRDDCHRGHPSQVAGVRAVKQLIPPKAG